jgi:hypothetical protein
MSVGFLSEMSAPPIHGGGVTLLRVLGADLKKLDWFAELIRYPHEPVPTFGKARYHSYPWWPIESMLRPFIGCDRSYRIAFHPLTRRLFAKNVVSQLLRHEPDIAGSRALVCPQADISLWVTEELRCKAGLRYISWVMDDHLIKWNRDSWCYPKGVEELMKRHLQHAEHVFVISPAMRDFYRMRFGVESEVLCGPAIPMPLSTPHPATVSSGSVRLVYFGSLGRWQNDAISLLAPLVKSEEVTLDVYTRNAEAMPVALREAGATVRGGIPEDQVLERSGSYDAVVLPVSFLPELRNMSYFNVATKFSECLASPAPTLLLGPHDSAMVRIAREASACFVADRPDPGLVAETVFRLSDASTRLAVKEAERALLKGQFSTAIMQGRWASVHGFLFP